MNHKNKFLIIALAALVLLSAFLMVLQKNNTSENRVAKIYQNGELIRQIEIDKLAEPIEFEITDESEHSNLVRAEHGKIRMVSADCPDKVCVNQGWIDSGIVPIVCLPNKVTIEITGGESELDAET